VKKYAITGQRFVKQFPRQRIDAVTDELLDVVISLRFALSYKREFIRELINASICR
jgi:hypothetical protein